MTWVQTDLEDISCLEPGGDVVGVGVQRDAEPQRAARGLQRARRGQPAPAAQRHAGALARVPPRLHPVLHARRAAAQPRGIKLERYLSGGSVSASVGLYWLNLYLNIIKRKSIGLSVCYLCTLRNLRKDTFHS